jgi:virginiamycin B lyase
MLGRRSLIALTSLALCLLALGGSSALAATPAEVTTFPIAHCFQGAIAPAPSGVYVRTCDEGDLELSKALVNLLPGGGATTTAVAASGVGPIATGPSGEVWIGARNPEGSAGEAERIERIAADGSVQAFPLAPAKHARVFRGLVVDRHGVAWVAIGAPYYDLLDAPQYDLGELMRISPDGSVRHFALRPGTEPQGLALGPRGEVWFTALSGHVRGWKTELPGFGSVGRLSGDGRITMFPVPGAHSVPEAIALGPEGKFWFTERRPSVICTISTHGKFGREYKPRFGRPTGTSLAFGQEGDLWAPLGKGLLRMTPTGRQTFYPGRAEVVAAATDGSIWTLDWTQVRRLVP